MTSITNCSVTLDDLSLSSGDFETWLNDVGQRFDLQNEAMKNRILDYLISKSGPSQLYHLSQRLGFLLKRDFLKHLPTELSFYIFRFLDPKSLLVCCQVSVTWNKLVNSCEEFWRQACVDVGAKCRELGNAKEYKTYFLNVYARQLSLRKSKALHSQLLYGHTDRVMALYYYNNILATGSDDRTIRLWDCTTGRCLKVYQSHTVADLKFDDQYIVTASFDNTAACWDMVTGERLRQYRAHVGAVFSVDYDRSADVLVTGGADYTVKIWMFSKGLVLQSLSTHSRSWVSKVLLQRPCITSSQFAVICMDQTRVYLWNIKNRQEVSDARQWASVHGSFLPSLLSQDTALYSCTTETHHEGFFMQKNFLKAHQQPEVIPLDFCGEKIKAMLGIGERFSMFFTELPIGENVLRIIRHNAKKLATIELPECRSTQRCSSLTIGESSWLNGFDGTESNRLFFAASLKDHSIYLLKWKDSSAIS
ncbi:F-box/WD repeat-containing protein 2-like [Watersipora subatra]|uniref:F-box/WD repeat-containing protein 2-like n=1 Tax=Watersipora subatra TaxID=2589382 RepID=UPI00355C689D